MQTLLKILGISVVVLATLTIGAAIFIGWWFDPNDYKSYVAEWVESRTGRDFVIEDDLELTFFPWLGVETGRLRLGNAEGFGAEAFATAERAIVRVKILPLLLARVEFGNLEVDGLVLNLARDVERRGNWEDLLPNAGPAAGTGDTTRGGALLDLNIKGIEISNGLVFWRDNTTEVRYIISGLSLETGPILIGQPVRTELRFQLVGVVPQFTAQITATGTALINPAGSRYLAEDLRLGFYVEDGRHEDRAAGSLQTSISVSVNDRTVTFSDSQLEMSLRNPPVGPAELQFGATWASGRLDLRSGTVDVVDLTTNTNGILATWEIAGRNLLDDPELTGTIRIEDESVGTLLDLLNLGIETGDAAATLGGFDLAAEFALRTASRELVLTNVSVSALDMQISAALSADAAGNASGNLAIPLFDPSAVLTLLPTAAVAGADFSEIESLALAAAFQFDGPRQQLSVREFRADVMATSITGELDYFRAERRYEGRVSTSAVDPLLVSRVFPNLLPQVLTPQRLGTLRLESGFAYDAVTDELTLDGLQAEGLGLLATGDLAVSELAESPHWTGTLQIQRFDPRELLRRFDRPSPVTADSGALASAVIDTRLDVTAERGIFEDIRLRLDDSTITGEVTVWDFGSPEYDFRLTIDRIDVDRYLPPQATARSGARAPADRSIALPTETMHDLALNGRVAIRDLRLAGLQFSDASALLAIGNGIGTIDSARGKLYGGDFEGGIELDARGGVQQLTLNGTAVGIQLEPFLVALRGESNLSGTGSFDVSLSGVGAGLDDVLETTAGRVTFSLRDGAIRGFNFGHAMCDFFNSLRGVPRPAPTDVDFTAFQSLRGSATVTEGIARTNDLEATTSFLEVTGRGQLDLATRDINYDLTGKLTQGIGIARCETLDRLIGDPIPVKLTGDVNAPELRFDFTEALELLAREAARKRLEAARSELEDELENRLLEGLEDLLDR